MFLTAGFLLLLRQLERSLDFIKQIRFYVSVVVFYSADCDNLLPVVFNKNDRRQLYCDKQRSFEKVPVLDKRNNRKQ